MATTRRRSNDVSTPKIETESGTDPRTIEGVVDAADEPEDVSSLGAMAAVRVKDAEQDIALKRFFATTAMLIMGTQLVATNVTFVLYGTRRWTVPDGVMIAYLTENFAQVVAVVLVITRHLFPSRDGGPGRRTAATRQ